MQVQVNELIASCNPARIVIAAQVFTLPATTNSWWDARFPREQMEQKEAGRNTSRHICGRTLAIGDAAKIRPKSTRCGYKICLQNCQGPETTGALTIEQFCSVEGPLMRIGLEA